nr:uncharacterized protein LOC129165430 [Nothobranchius furzeri]
MRQLGQISAPLGLGSELRKEIISQVNSHQHQPIVVFSSTFPLCRQDVYNLREACTELKPILFADDATLVCCGENLNQILDTVHKELSILKTCQSHTAFINVRSLMCARNTDSRVAEMGSLHLLLIFCKICQVVNVGKISEIIQDSGIKMAKIGENVTLHCTCRDTSVTSFAWYLQSLGTKPHLLSSRMKHSPKAEITPLYQKRFEVFAQSQNGISDLKISYLQLSDPGTYYCGTLTFNAIQFGQGVFLQVKTSLSNRRSVIYQPVNRTLRLGQTMNLSCTVYTEPCAGNTSLFWFRDGSSHPDVMYPSEGNCKNLSDYPRHGKSCTLNLEINSVSSSDAGIYHCALIQFNSSLFI